MRLSIFFLCALFAAQVLYAEGDISNLKEYDYRSNGRPWRCSVYNAETGRIKGMVYYSPDGNINKMEKFDGDGKKTDEAFYDSKGRLALGPDNWAAMRWFYDQGVLRLRVSYDEQGKAIEKMFYDESGRLMGRMYRDDERVNPYVNAAMHRMLGGNNVAYYDPVESRHQATQLLED